MQHRLKEELKELKVALFDSQKSFQIPLKHVLKIAMHNFEPHITLASVF